MQQLQLAGVNPTASARDSAQTMPGTTHRMNEATSRHGGRERVLKKYSTIGTAEAHLYASSAWTVSEDPAKTRVFGIVLTSRNCLKSARTVGAKGRVFPEALTQASFSWFFFK